MIGRNVPVRGGPSRNVVLVALALVGIAGYVITWLVPLVAGLDVYATFAVYWSFAFLIAAGLSGIQQEITRSTRPAAELPGANPGVARRFALITAASVLAVILLTAPFWQNAIFGSDGWALVIPLALGASANVFLVVFTGTLYGMAVWGALFWVILLEGAFRLALIAVALLTSGGPVALAWAIAAPFAIAPLIVWPFIRSRVVGFARLDVGARQLLWNTSRTTVAAVSMGALVSGFPLLLTIAAPAASGDEYAIVVLTVTLVRAPIIVVGMTLQSLLVTVFRSAAATFRRTLAALVVVVVAVGAIIAVAGYWAGPWVFTLLFPNQPAPDSMLIAVVAASSALIGVLCVTAPAELALSRHGVFTAGWVVAVIVTIACLLLPLPFEPRAILAMIAGPLAGVLVHAVDLLGPARRAIDSAAQAAR